MIFYPSGTTGRPKGGHDASELGAQISALVEAWDGSQRHMLLALPLHHVHAIINGLAAHSPFARHVNPARVRRGSRVGATRLGDITVFTAVPTIYAS